MPFKHRESSVVVFQYQSLPKEAEIATLAESRSAGSSVPWLGQCLSHGLQSALRDTAVGADRIT